MKTPRKARSAEAPSAKSEAALPPDLAAYAPPSEGSDTLPFALPEAEEQYKENMLQYIEAKYAEGGDLLLKELSPLSNEGLELQAKFLHAGTHPFQVMYRLMLNPFVKPGTRIQAARVLLDFGARKPPSSTELTGKDGAPLNPLDPKVLGMLKDDELSQLQGLIETAIARSTKKPEG
jgi:hypothetical protein